MGVSKHYILASMKGNHVDYQIPAQLLHRVPECARTIAEQNRLTNVLTVLNEGPLSWRRKTVTMWGEIPNDIKGHFRLTEYLVYPGRSHKRCNWRKAVGGIRKRPQDNKLFGIDFEIPHQDIREAVLPPGWVQNAVGVRAVRGPNADPVRIPLPENRRQREFHLAFGEAV